MQTFLRFAKIITREIFYERSLAKMNTRETQFFFKNYVYLIMFWGQSEPCDSYKKNSIAYN